ncbi:MAG: hypothetical protein Alpg2KO_08290 [Alphaproteobacteria bacterium]
MPVIYKNSRRGVTALSYGLLVGLIGVVALAAISGSGSSINQLFGDTSSALGGVADSAGAGGSQAGPSPDSSPDVTGLASCNEINSTAPGLPDGSYEIDPDGSGGNAPFNATCDMTTDGGGWTLVYDYTLPSGNQDIGTVSQADAMSSVNLSAQPLTYTRVAYRLELDSQFAFAAMDDFTGGQLNRTGMPMDWVYDQSVSNLFVESNSGLVTNASNASGKIEFWSNCYNQSPNSVFDFDDSIDAADCYGSLQVFNMDQSGQGILQYNGWSNGNSGQDLGIGNHVQGSNPFCPNNPVNPDWTFCFNSGQYSSRQLKVYVK